MKIAFLSIAASAALLFAGCEAPWLARYWGHDRFDDEALAARGATETSTRYRGEKIDGSDSRTSPTAVASYPDDIGPGGSESALGVGTGLATGTDDTLRRGQVAEDEGRLAEARTLYENVLSAQPQNATANHRLAIIADKEGRYADAERYYRIAATQAPRDVNLLSDMGYSFFLQRRYEEAEVTLRQALLVSPQHPLALNNLAYVYATRYRTSRVPDDYYRAKENFRLASNEQQAEATLRQLIPEGPPGSAIAQNEVATPNPFQPTSVRHGGGAEPAADRTGSFQAPDPQRTANTGPRNGSSPTGQGYPNHPATGPSLGLPGPNLVPAPQIDPRTGQPAYPSAQGYPPGQTPPQGEAPAVTAAGRPGGVMLDPRMMSPEQVRAELLRIEGMSAEQVRGGPPPGQGLAPRQTASAEYPGQSYPPVQPVIEPAGGLVDPRFPNDAGGPTGPRGAPQHTQPRNAQYQNYPPQNNAPPQGYPPQHQAPFSPPAGTVPYQDRTQPRGGGYQQGMPAYPPNGQQHPQQTPQASMPGIELEPYGGWENSATTVLPAGAQQQDWLNNGPVLGPNNNGIWDDSRRAAAQIGLNAGQPLSMSAGPGGGQSMESQAPGYPVAPGPDGRFAPAQGGAPTGRRSNPYGAAPANYGQGYPAGDTGVVPAYGERGAGMPPQGAYPPAAGSTAYNDLDQFEADLHRQWQQNENLLQQYRANGGRPGEGPQPAQANYGP